jgi:hypothetical protein
MRGSTEMGRKMRQIESKIRGRSRKHREGE